MPQRATHHPSDSYCTVQEPDKCHRFALCVIRQFGSSQIFRLAAPWLGMRLIQLYRKPCHGRKASRPARTTDCGNLTYLLQDMGKKDPFTNPSVFDFQIDIGSINDGIHNMRTESLCTVSTMNLYSLHQLCLLQQMVTVKTYSAMQSDT